LRANPAANLRQTVRAMGHLGGFEQVALLNQLQLIGDIVVYRTLPFVIRIAAAEAAPSLQFGRFTAKLAVDLPIVLNIDFDYGLGRILPRNLQELHWIRHAGNLGSQPIPIYAGP
jgi:hypothetical protein